MTLGKSRSSGTPRAAAAVAAVNARPGCSPSRCRAQFARREPRNEEEARALDVGSSSARSRFCCCCSPTARTLVIAPQGAKAAKLQQSADAVQLADLQAAAPSSRRGCAADDRDRGSLPAAHVRCPTGPNAGIILTLSDLARSSGIKFDLIEPVNAAQRKAARTRPTGSTCCSTATSTASATSSTGCAASSRCTTASSKRAGRLFNVDTVTFNVLTDSFPKISAELFVNAYVYGAGSAAAARLRRRRPTARRPRRPQPRPPPRPTPRRRPVPQRQGRPRNDGDQEETHRCG